MRSEDPLVELVARSEIDLRMLRQVGLEALLAAADPQQRPVLLRGPAEREAELLERAVERDQVPVELGLGEHAVAVEDEGAPAHAAAPARPAEPNSWMCSMTVSVTESRIWSKSFTGSHLPVRSASLRWSRAEYM